MGRTEQRHIGHLDDAEEALARVVTMLLQQTSRPARSAAADLEAARGELRAAKLRDKSERRGEVEQAIARIRSAGETVASSPGDVEGADTVVSVIRIVLGGLGSAFADSQPPSKATERPRAKTDSLTTARVARRGLRSSKRTMPMGGDGDPKE